MNPQDPVPYYFWGGASLLVTLLIWRGWRSGVVRQVAELLALVCAGLCAYLMGGAVGAALNHLGYPNLVLRVLGSGLVFSGVFIAINIFSMILFKKTEQQSFAPVRLFFGLGGAVVGAFFGLVLVLSAVVGVRLYGTLLEPRVEAPPPRTTVPGWAVAVVHLKQSFAGIPGLSYLDPLSQNFYATTDKLGRTLNDPRALLRFFQTPELSALAYEPKIAKLAEDKALLQAATQGDYGALLRNPNLVAAANDPEIARRLGGTNFRRALDSALAPAPPGR